MKKFILGITAALFTTVLWADGSWKCANTIAEVSCAKQGGCNASSNTSESFNISIRNNNQVSVCAKGRCWRGLAEPTISGNQSIYPIKQFNWTTLDQPNAEYVLAVNRNSQTLSLQGNGQNYQMQCTQA